MGAQAAERASPSRCWKACDPDFSLAHFLPRHRTLSAVWTGRESALEEMSVRSTHTSSESRVGERIEGLDGNCEGCGVWCLDCVAVDRKVFLMCSCKVYANYCTLNL